MVGARLEHLRAFDGEDLAMTRVVSVDVAGSVTRVVLSAGGVAVAMVGPQDAPAALREEFPFVGLVEDAGVGELL